jgi:hypothetical protein
MGLMYIFPVSTDENERVEITQNPNQNSQNITLKTYGLPMIFWGYLAASLSVLAIMWMASKSVIDKLLTYNDPSLIFLAYLVKLTLIFTPIILLGFFFYEKQIVKSGDQLSLVYKVFYIKIFSKKFKMDGQDSFEVNHHLDSPNMAKIYHKEELKQFENKGYFELKIKSNNNLILIDRHTRKADLIKIKELLSKF